jgi:hypothetical protein
MSKTEQNALVCKIAALDIELFEVRINLEHYRKLENKLIQKQDKIRKELRTLKAQEKK